MDSFAYDYLPCDFTVVDVETTISPDGITKLIEVAAVRVRGNLVADKYFSTINPGCPIRQDSFNVSGLCDDDVSLSPSSAEFLPGFISFIGSDVILGHNISSDVALLSRESGIVLSNNQIDTLKLSQQLSVSSPGYKLEDLCTYFNVPPMQKHRALFDCYSTYLVYTHLISLYAESKLKITPIEEPDENDHSPIASSARLMLSVYNRNPFFFKDKNVVFTQVFTSFDRTHAETIVRCTKGTVQEAIKKDTNYLIVGNELDERTMKKANNSGVSGKILKAEEFNEKYKEKGVHISIMSESDFLNLLEQETHG